MPTNCSSSRPSPRSLQQVFLCATLCVFAPLIALAHPYPSKSPLQHDHINVNRSVCAVTFEQGGVLVWTTQKQGKNWVHTGILTMPRKKGRYVLSLRNLGIQSINPTTRFLKITSGKEVRFHRNENQTNGEEYGESRKIDAAKSEGDVAFISFEGRVLKLEVTSITWTVDNHFVAPPPPMPESEAQ